mmetsp:Transcript_19910/g.33991  ORF Transcript_19910/g.33991 Transcript_19910/m.33991 type:complete len:211 (-) Transcript_19910:1200-1832(-)
MAEGGVLPWKIQKIDQSRGPAASFKGIKDPLPKPPKGQAWFRNPDTKEWTLVQTREPDSGKDRVNVAHGVLVKGLVDTSIPEATIVAKAAPLETKKKAPQENNGYVEHVVVPTDTFQGICLRYKVSPTELRRANKFSGSNLTLAPSTLMIPLSAGLPPPPQAETPEFKIAKVISNVPHLARSEAKAYLELNDWDATAAIANALEDMRMGF